MIRTRPSFMIHFHLGIYPMVIRVFKWNQQQWCFKMIRTRPSFNSLSFGYLPQRAHIKLMRQVAKVIHRKY